MVLLPNNATSGDDSVVERTDARSMEDVARYLGGLVPGRVRLFSSGLGVGRNQQDLRGIAGRYGYGDYRYAHHATLGRRGLRNLGRSGGAQASADALNLDVLGVLCRERVGA